MDDIEVLSERHRSLQIMNKALKETYESLDKEMSIEPTPVMMNNNIQATMPKSMVPDLE